MSDKKHKKKIPKGEPGRKCEKCGTARGLIRKYKMNICRRCFRENAEKMGFKKY
ncbi:30S ribosomal protein S14 [archaeon]|nr:30S ribosomal protein S14 [archaeon]